MRTILTLAALLATATPALAADPTPKPHDAMHANAMKHDAMKHDAMKHTAMKHSAMKHDAMKPGPKATP